MKTTSVVITTRNLYHLAAVVVLIFSFIGCISGSCLSYGHSCWGAHGKRSGDVRAQDIYPGGNRRFGPYNEKLLFRIFNRPLPPPELQQSSILLEEPVMIPNFDDTIKSLSMKRSGTIVDKNPETISKQVLSITERKLSEPELLDTASSSHRRDNKEDDDLRMRMKFYKILFG